MTLVHPTAIVSPRAHLEDGAIVGAYCIIEDSAVIRGGTQVKPFAVVCERTIVGGDCEIGYGTVVGAPAQHTTFHSAKSRVVVGDRVVIREYATVHRSIREDGETRVGNDCYLMAFSHIGHDCVLGDGVVLTHMATLGGHCRLGDRCIVGGSAVVHQRVDIGTLAMIGGASGVALSVLPYAMVSGSPPAKIIGVNVRGMERAGIPKERIHAVEDAFRLVRRVRERDRLLESLRGEIVATPERDEVLRFLENHTAVSHF
jgi:UDP-N-acetylglucosamine acyltransferase